MADIDESFILYSKLENCLNNLNSSVVKINLGHPKFLSKGLQLFEQDQIFWDLDRRND